MGDRGRRARAYRILASLDDTFNNVVTRQYLVSRRFRRFRRYNNYQSPKRPKVVRGLGFQSVIVPSIIPSIVRAEDRGSLSSSSVHLSFDLRTGCSRLLPGGILRWTRVSGLLIGKGMDPRSIIGDQGMEVFVKGRWRAEGAILESDEEGSQIRDDKDPES